MFEDRYNRISQPFQLGQTMTLNINPGDKILSGSVIVEGTATISGSTANGTPICEGGPIGLIKQIRIVANKAAGSRYPGGPLVKCRPQTLLRYAITERGGKFIGEISGSTFGSGANGVYPFYLSIPIYFADSLNRNYQQTALNADQVDTTGAPIYTALQLQVDFITLLSEIFSGNNGTLAITANLQWKDDRLALPFDTTPLVQEDHLDIIQAANSEHVDQSMPNDGAFVSWLLLEQQGSPGFQLASTLLNQLTLRGSTINFQEYADDITQKMLDDGLWDPSQSTAGQKFIDFAHGLLANSNPAAGLQHVMDINNPSGPGLDRLLIYTRRVFGLPKASN